MNKPTVKSGKLTTGTDFRCGEGVVIDVAEEVVLGDRVVLGDNTYLCGRRVEIGSDFFGYSHWGKRLEVGLGRRDEEDAVLTVGDRCTFHDNKIDLARRVTIGNDVGLSPEVTIYTHYYWQSVLEGYPCKYASVRIDDGVIVGYRATILPGVRIEHHAVVGAGAVVTKNVYTRQVWVGNPARRIGEATPMRLSLQLPHEPAKQELLRELVEEYERSVVYRGLYSPNVTAKYPHVVYSWGSLGVMASRLDVEKLNIEGNEDEFTDDIRWFLFCRGIRIFTKRPFAKIPRRI